MLPIDDPAVIGASRWIAIHFCDRLLHRFDELRHAAFMDKSIVGRDAGLAAIGELAPGDAFGRLRDIGALIHDDRRLAAEFECDGGKMLGRRRHDHFADRPAAGEEDMIERQIEQRSRHRRIALECGGSFQSKVSRMSFVMTAEQAGLISEGLTIAGHPAAMADVKGPSSKLTG
jgi:hypothetical protein